MMLLAIEIWLTLRAWRSGWRWRALAPLASLAGMALLVGIAVSAGGGSVDAAMPVGILLDIGAIVWLSVLGSKAPHRPAAGTPAESAEVAPKLAA